MPHTNPFTFGALALDEAFTRRLRHVVEFPSLEAAREFFVKYRQVYSTTGMGRLGIRFDQLSEFVAVLERFRNVRIDGVMTHLAAADDASCQPLTRDQIQRFEEAVTVFRDHGYRPTHLHLANSAGIFGHRESWGNLVRPGGVLYGLWRDVLPLSTSLPGLLPVMSLHSRICLTNDTPVFYQLFPNLGLHCHQFLFFFRFRSRSNS